MSGSDKALTAFLLLTFAATGVSRRHIPIDYKTLLRVVNDLGKILLLRLLYHTVRPIMLVSKLRDHGREGVFSSRLRMVEIPGLINKFGLGVKVLRLAQVRGFIQVNHVRCYVDRRYVVNTLQPKLLSSLCRLVFVAFHQLKARFSVLSFLVENGIHL